MSWGHGQGLCLDPQLQCPAVKPTLDFLPVDNDINDRIGRAPTGLPQSWCEVFLLSARWQGRPRQRTDKGAAEGPGWDRDTATPSQKIWLIDPSIHS